MEIELDILPVGQMRARATARGKFARVYKDAKQIIREAELAALLQPYRAAARGLFYYEGELATPLVVVVDAYLPIPKSVPAGRRRSPFTGEVIPMREWQELAVAGYIRPTVVPDVDNIVKHLLDVMQSMEMMKDDKQVVDQHTRKWYSFDPHLTVKIDTLALYMAAMADEKFAVPY